MTHQIDILEDGRASMAYVNEVPWHGLGQQLTPDADLEIWKEEAGMLYKILEAPVLYLDQLENAQCFDDHKVLYRDDNGAPLAIVHKSYHTVQPETVIDFFRTFVEKRQMTLETAGTLNGGRKMWALARIGKDIKLKTRASQGSLDVLKNYVLLATSCDKSIASTGRLTNVRVVCNNTLTMAYGDNSSVAKVTHRTAFDQTAQDNIQRELGLINEEIEKAEETYKKMIDTPLKKEEAIGFFLSLFDKSKNPEHFIFDEIPLRKITQMWEAYNTAPGSELDTAKDTLWGAVSAVTYTVDHNVLSRSTDSRLDNAWFGGGEVQKNRAVTQAVEIIKGARVINLFNAIQTNPDRLHDLNMLEPILAVAGSMR